MRHPPSPRIYFIYPLLFRRQTSLFTCDYERDRRRLVHGCMGGVGLDGQSNSHIRRGHYCIFSLIPARTLAGEWWMGRVLCWLSRSFRVVLFFAHSVETAMVSSLHEL